MTARGVDKGFATLVTIAGGRIGGSTAIVAHVPQAEMMRYATQLRSITGGRGSFTVELDHYDIVPTHIAGPIMEAHKKEMEAKKEE